MDRKEFLQLLSPGTALLFAGCLGSCATARLPTATAPPRPATGEPTLDLRLDLSAPAHADLHDPRRVYVYVAGGQIIVAKKLDGTYLAVSASCPHAGHQLRYERRENQFECPAHGSQFKASGALLTGPSPRGLRPYRVSRTGSELHIEG